MKTPRANADVYKKLAKLAYKKHAGEIEKQLKGTPFQLDTSLSDREHKVFYDPNSKKVVVAYRGTDPRDRFSVLGDLRSDYNILIGKEGRDRRFKRATKQFKSVIDKYQQQGYTFDTTGHSLGGALATPVTKKFPNRVSENLNYRISHSYSSEKSTSKSVMSPPRNEEECDRASLKRGRV